MRHAFREVQVSGQGQTHAGAYDPTKRIAAHAAGTGAWFRLRQPLNTCMNDAALPITPEGSLTFNVCMVSIITKPS
jgi:hypothetical protein